MSQKARGNPPPPSFLIFSLSASLLRSRSSSSAANLGAAGAASTRFLPRPAQNFLKASLCLSPSPSLLRHRDPELISARGWFFLFLFWSFADWLFVLLERERERELEEMESEKKSSAVSDVGAWAMNVVSSVGIIMANKQLMSSSGYGFSFATTLTGFHFAVTAMVGLVSNAAGYSASKYVPMWELLWFSIVANMSITGMNFSLMLNSVGFYQISKLSMIPVVCVMEWILHSKHYSREVKMAVMVVVVGVGVCTVTDVKVNAKGFICACVAVLSTSLQQISIGSLQKKYSIGSFELLSKTAPIQAVSLLVFGPFVDYFLNGKAIIDYKMSYGALFFILLSCSLAVFCNMSQYLCIGRFSATSFQVLGHMKTVCVLILGWVLFDSALTLKNIMGMIIAVLGMVVYSWAVELEKQSNAKTALNVKNSLTEEEIRLLKEGVEHPPAKDIELGDSKV